MRVSTMRKKIISVYPGSISWKLRVMAMKDNQVMAIFFSMKEKGIFETKEKDGQISLFDLYPECMHINGGNINDKGTSS